MLGGAERPVLANEKHYLKPMGQLSITILDPSGKPTSARVSVTGEDGKAYAPDNAWMHAEDNFVRSESAFESHYFHSPGKAELTVPEGRIQVEVTKGFEYHVARENVICSPRAQLVILLKPLQIPKEEHSHWASADLHVHMNYGGAYRNTPKDLVAQQTAENLFLVENLVVNKEQRIPDITSFRTTPDPASTPNHLLLHGQEFHTSYWGHLSLLNLTHNFLLPDYASYGNTAAASLFPTNAVVADLVHQQQGLVGYAHPFDIEEDPATDPTLTHGEPLDEALELPVDAALGKVDYVEVMGFSDHRMTASVWYRLLNCGFRLPAGAGSDTMANYASLRGPVGLTRVYASVPDTAVGTAPWFDSLKQGRTFVTNGPLLGFTLGGKAVGEELKLPAGENKVMFTSSLRSFVPVDHFEVICNGRVLRDLKTDSDRQTADVKGTIAISQTGWCVLRASSDQPEHPVLDDYVYATTSPIYVSVEGSVARPADDAAFFITWIDRLVQATKANNNWNTTAERASVLQMLDQARQVYVRLQK
jgi:hypothetical protein